ncbi:MAG: hypothetical protein ACK4GJ_01775, partial [bacterium]
MKVLRNFVRWMFLKMLITFLLINLISVKGGVEKMTYPFKLPEMGYKYDALEPYIDALTMEI